MRRLTVTVALIGSLALLALPVPSGHTQAPEKYPVKPITALVGFPPGGSTDLLARALEAAAKKYLTQPLVVVNRAGGVGTIAVTELTRAKPDGYTICVCPAGPFTTQPHLADLPYTDKDYVPVIHIAKFVGVLSVRSEAPWKTIQELLAHIRAQPGQVRISHAGAGTINHLGLEELRLVAKLDFTPVPTGGGGPAVVAMLGGHVEASAHNTNEVIAQVEAGKARVLAVFADQRSARFPQAPTFKEVGHDVQAPNFYVIAVPKATPAPITKALHDAFKKAMEDPAFVSAAEKLVFELEYLPGEEAGRRLGQTYAKNEELIRKLGLTKKK